MISGVQDLTALADPARSGSFVQNNCVDFEPAVCRALAEVAVQGYRSQASIDFLRVRPVELPDRLISPVRVTDVSEPVSIELPGIVHRFEEGHRLAVVLAGGDFAYRGATALQQVSVSTGREAAQTLTVPAVG